MSQTVPGSNEPKPATAATPAPPQEFDLLAFWIQNRKLITRLFALALLAVAAWGVMLFLDYRKRAGSEEALSKAQNAEEYRKVITEWAGTPAAGTASIYLADELRAAGKTEEAAKVLRDFLAADKVHPLRVNAALALAISLEIAGKNDEALAAYQEFTTSHSRSAFVPAALVGQARVLTTLNRTEEAQRVLESASQKFPRNPFTNDAFILLDQIKNQDGRKTGGSPRPATPAPAPAPAPGLNLQVPPAPSPTSGTGTGLNLSGETPAPQPPPAPGVPATPEK